MPHKALFVGYCVYYIHTETFIILPAFYFKSFQNPKMLKYVATHHEWKRKRSKAY